MNINSKTVKFIKKHNNATIPSRAHSSDSGYDITASDMSVVFNEKTGYISYIAYDTGISIEPPGNMYFLLYPRSSVRKYDLSLCNSVGVIDTSYRGNVVACFTPTFPTKSTDDIIIYNIGDRIAQLIPQLLLDITFEETSDINKTERDDGGFGSSGS
ncbi:dUTP diphosphatase [Candidatus Pacearchaeota archaeon]|jgi:dUTP pyrophosphatase|nr:dUTP diphosphatase [Candidatus Pacearchaeota archaeon]|tara:strand:+ start:213 stop:683 length:471 start_codon:yes stop_codon:yes gene_type:complete